ncbi:MAG TPA: class I SAM-dependent methyltransferase [Acidimicrobiia bacterium]|jgi:predicted O-methyltransferase YrrM
MRRESVTNLLRNALRPGYAQVIGRKALNRVGRRDRSGAEACAWARAHCTTAAAVCEALDATLWAEALEFRDVVTRRADEVSDELGEKVGYGARSDLLYFTIRWLKPDVVVETGVAYGYSSFTALSALARNGQGRLLSSDFPFFRERDPERLVGSMVPPELRDGWRLLTRGDAHNLPAILAEIDHIDLLHYDSDKSYAGRKHALDLLLPRLSPSGVVIMDDIEDNTFFRDYVTHSTPAPDYAVIGQGAHFMGTLGLTAHTAQGARNS